MLESILHWLDGHQLPCPVKHFLKVDCPGCGFQRSFMALLRGDIPASFHLHPATIPLILLLLFAFAHLVYRFKKGDTIIIYSYIFITLIILTNFVYKLV